MYRYFTIAILILSLLALLSGCSKNTASQQDDPYADFGGITPTDEDPAFGDAEMLAELTDNEEIEDEILMSPTVDSIIDDAEESGTYALRILWGSLEFDSTVTELTDWTGSLTVSRGAEIVRRVICFERGQDYIEPRTDRKLIEWVSFTSVHYDGIFVNLYIPPADVAETASVDEPVTVTFATDPFTITFNIEELIRLDTIYQLDDSINAVAFRAIKIYPDACPKGFMEGRWGRDDDGNGVFRGHWISQHGALAGFVRGHWGTDPDGNAANMFYGKWIDINGRFSGFLKGEYKPRPDTRARCCGGGWLRGLIYNADRNPIGAMHGHYLRARCNCNGKMGYFHARWKTFCPTVEPVDDGINK